jgi:hypothetical protein
MTYKLEQTISHLVETAAPVKKLARPQNLLFTWLGGTICSTALIVFFMQPRPDLATKLTSALFLAEITTLFILIITIALAAVWLCFPDLRQRPKTLLLPLLPLSIFTVLSLYRSAHPELSALPAPEAVSGLDCALCITMLAAVPGAWMFHILRRHATIFPQWAGAFALLAAASIGLLVLKLVEDNDSILHLLTWHISPMLLLTLLGYFVGKKYLSW